MKPVIPVACGVLRKPSGEVLIARRPQGKIAAGKWEFPGGKIEAAESPLAALVRELREELGIEVRDARPLIYLSHDYSDRRVILDTWLVTAWEGEPAARERQGLAWVLPVALTQYDLLAADGPIVRALKLPSHYVFTRPEAEPDSIIEGLDNLPAGALLRLRLPGLDDAAYGQVASSVLAEAGKRGLRLVLDRAPEMVGALGADGWHASSRVLRKLGKKPPGLVLASVHDLSEMQQARDIGCDAVVLGPVLETASHPDAGKLDWKGFSSLAKQAHLPVYAIGGMSAAHLSEAFLNHAQGVAGISAFWGNR